MPLNTFNLPGKNVPADKQLAMMRNYLENLKDDIESDLYNIDWNNFSKPLREKLEGLDKELIAQGDVVNSIQANYVSTQYLETNYLTAQQISSTYVTTQYLTSDYIYTKTLDASQITTGRISADHMDANTIYTSNISSYAISTSYLDVNGKIQTAYLESDVITSDYLFVNGKIDAQYLDVGAITADCVYTTDLYVTDTTNISSSHLSAGQISAVFTSSNNAEFNRINLGYVPKSNSSSALRIAAGGSYANVYLKATNVAGQYYLVVNMPD